MARDPSNPKPFGRPNLGRTNISIGVDKKTVEIIDAFVKTLRTHDPKAKPGHVVDGAMKFAKKKRFNPRKYHSVPKSP